MLTAKRPSSVTFFDAYPHVTGGSHQVSITIATELRSRTGVHFLTTGEGPFTEELDSLGFDRSVVQLPGSLMTYGHNTQGHKAMLAASLLPLAWDRIRRRIPSNTAILHASDLRGVLLAGPAARAMKVPVVWHVHLGERSTTLNRLAGLTSNSIVIPDPSTLESAPGLPMQKVQVVPNAVQHDVLARDPVTRGGCRLVTSSRLVPQKGLDLLLEAVASVRNSFSPIRLDVYGGEQKGYEAYARKIRLRLTELGLDQTVTLRGHRARPYTYWSEAAVYVQASRWENYPVAVLEAMALGLPVVATDVGAMAKIVENGRTGILVPPGDPPSLARAIIGLLDNPLEADAMGSAGRERVLRDFVPSVMTNRIMSIFEAVTVGSN